MADNNHRKNSAGKSSGSRFVPGDSLSIMSFIEVNFPASRIQDPASSIRHSLADVAQLVEQLTRNEQVCGSIPHVGSMIKSLQSVIFCRLYLCARQGALITHSSTSEPGAAQNELWRPSRDSWKPDSETVTYSASMNCPVATFVRTGLPDKATPFSFNHKQSLATVSAASPRFVSFNH